LDDTEKRTHRERMQGRNRQKDICTCGGETGASAEAAGAGGDPNGAGTGTGDGTENKDTKKEKKHQMRKPRDPDAALSKASPSRCARCTSIQNCPILPEHNKQDSQNLYAILGSDIREVECIITLQNQ